MGTAIEHEQIVADAGWATVRADGLATIDLCDSGRFV